MTTLPVPVPVPEVYLLRSYLTLLSLMMSIDYYMYPLLNTSLICIPRFPQLSICGRSAVESSPTRSRLVCCPLSVVRLASLAHLSFCTCPEKS